MFSNAQLTPFATNHRFVSFTLYLIGFVGFVLSLKRGYLKQQFGLFCWVHMTLLLIVVSRCESQPLQMQLHLTLLVLLVTSL